MEEQHFRLAHEVYRAACQRSSYDLPKAPSHHRFPHSSVYTPILSLIQGSCVTAFRRGVIFVGRGWEREVSQLYRLSAPTDQAPCTYTIFSEGVILQGVISHSSMYPSIDP